MSKDVVIGIAILDKSRSPEHLLVRCQPYGKPEEFASIPVYARGTAKPQTPAWEYFDMGGILEVRPSLRIMSHKDGDPDRFHNDGVWTVKFFECPPNEDAYAVYRKVNDLKEIS